MTTTIHPSAIIEDGAQIGKDCRIGPFCHIGPKAKLGDGIELISHVTIAGLTTIGDHCRIFPFASIGHEPQDLKFQGEQTELIIGADCIIREGVTMNPGTAGDASKTVIGDKCIFLANSHVAHDCIIGNNVIMSNGTLVAGHCKIGDNVIFGGGAGVHQFCRIGRNAFVGGMAGVENDVIPYGTALGNRAYLGGLNIVGMKRAGLSRDAIHAARNVFKHLFSGDRPILEAIASVDPDLGEHETVRHIVDFIQADAMRALCVPKPKSDEKL